MKRGPHSGAARRQFRPGERRGSQAGPVAPLRRRLPVIQRLRGEVLEAPAPRPGPGDSPQRHSA